MEWNRRIAVDVEENCLELFQGIVPELTRTEEHLVPP
jgi:hypothetical protein